MVPTARPAEFERFRSSSCGPSPSPHPQRLHSSRPRYKSAAPPLPHTTLTNPLERSSSEPPGILGLRSLAACPAPPELAIPSRPLSVSMAASTKTVAALLAAVLLALVASAAASRKLEEDAALLGNLAPAPAPAVGAAAGIAGAAPGAWAVAALVSLVAFLAH
uniref:Uncharacterized protein n=3 Tax=Setaria TaxID=4554 RepID=K3XMP1_SETIT